MQNVDMSGEIADYHIDSSESEESEQLENQSDIGK